MTSRERPHESPTIDESFAVAYDGSWDAREMGRGNQDEEGFKALRMGTNKE